MGVAWTVKIKTLTQCYVNSGLTPQTRDHHSANVGSCCQAVFSSSTDILPMLFQWWASVFDAGPALIQHWVTVSCFSAQLSELGDLQGVYEWYWWGCSRLPPQAFWPYWPSGVGRLADSGNCGVLCGTLRSITQAGRARTSQNQTKVTFTTIFTDL